MKLAVLGDSFTGCLKEAITETLGLTDPHELTFFAGPSKTMEGFYRDGEALVAGNDHLLNYLRITSGLDHGRLYPDEYDGFVIVGLGIDLRPLPARTYSVAAIEAACRGLLENSLAWSLIKRLQSFGQRPIYCIAAPLRALNAEKFAKTYPGPLLSYDRQAGACDRVMRACGVELIFQPAATRSDDLRTNPEFSQGSVRLIQGTPHPGEDVTHMNAEYGRHVLEALVARLRFADT